MPHTSIGGQLLGFEVYRDAEEKRKKKAEKGKRREKLEKRKTNYSNPQGGCKYWAFLQ